MSVNREMVQATWEKARALPDRDPDRWRLDPGGAWLQREQYGNDGSEFGWEIVEDNGRGGYRACHLRSRA